MIRIEKSAHTPGHDHRCIVTKHDGGWEVREELDSHTVTDVVRKNWTRVEIDLKLFEYRYRHDN